MWSKWSARASLLGSHCGWAWGCGGAGEVAPVVVSEAEGEEGVALGGVDGRVGRGLLGGVAGKEPV